MNLQKHQVTKHPVGEELDKELPKPENESEIESKSKIETITKTEQAEVPVPFDKVKHTNENSSEVKVETKPKELGTENHNNIFEMLKNLEKNSEAEAGNKDKLLKCKHCKEKFSSRHFLQKHQVLIHPLSTTNTKNIKTFFTKKDPKTHSSSHPLPTGVKCEHCDNTFVNKSALTKHMENIHPRPQINDQESASGHKQKSPRKTLPIGVKCEHCDNTYVSKSSLTKHMNNIHPRPQINDQDIESGLKQESPRKTHPTINKMTHPLPTGVKDTEVKCSHCDLTLQTKTLTKHIDRLHPHIMSKSCDIGMTSIDIDELIEEKEKEAEKEAEEKEEVEDKLKNKDEAKDMLEKLSYKKDPNTRNVGNDTPDNIGEEHKCPECVFIAYKLTNMKQHIDTFHKNTPRLKCEYCTKTLKNKRTLNTHINRMHESKIQNNFTNNQSENKKEDAIKKKKNIEPKKNKDPENMIQPPVNFVGITTGTKLTAMTHNRLPHRLFLTPIHNKQLTLSGNPASDMIEASIEDKVEEQEPRGIPRAFDPAITVDTPIVQTFSLSTIHSSDSIAAPEVGATMTWTHHQGTDDPDPDVLLGCVPLGKEAEVTFPNYLTRSFARN
jgi:hypothetical protein